MSRDYFYFKATDPIYLKPSVLKTNYPRAMNLEIHDPCVLLSFFSNVQEKACTSLHYTLPIYRVGIDSLINSEEVPMLHPAVIVLLKSALWNGG